MRKENYISFTAASSALLALLFLSSPAALTAEPAGETKTRLTWIAYEQAPYFIRKGPLKNKGVGDFLMKELMARMSEFEHRVIYANVSRYAVAVTNPSICVAAAWLNDEEEQLLHSRIHTVEPPMGLLTLRDTNIPRFADNSTSLAHIMANTDLSLLALKLFHYPEATLRVMSMLEPAGRVMYLNTETIEINEGLLEHGRADIAMALPGQLADLNAAGKGQIFKFIQIEEYTEYVRLMTHCSNDPVGRAAMKVINETLTNEFLETLLAKYKGWYSELDDFEQIYRTSVIQGKPLPNVIDRYGSQLEN